MMLVISGDCDAHGKGKIFFANISKEIWRKEPPWKS